MTSALAWLTWAVPIVYVVASIIIVRRMTWRWHPALITYLVVECWIQVLLSAHVMTRDWAIWLKMLVGSWLIAEVATLSRIGLAPKVRASLAGMAIAACAFYAGLNPWTTDRLMSLFRADFRLVLALGAIAILAYRWRVPAFERHGECRRHRILRRGVAAWMTVEAAQASFVKGGAGMLFVRYTPQLWAWIGLLTCAALIITVAALALGIYASAPGRKRGAINPKTHRVVTGSIELQQKVA